MRTTLIPTTLAALLAAGCSSTSPAPAPGPAPTAKLRRWGTTREALREGDTKARVALADAGIAASTYGLGALEGLAGEVTIDGGTVWISEAEGADRFRTTRDAPADRKATMLFLEDVARWTEHPVERDVPPAELDAYVGELFAKAGLDPKEPRLFTVEGPLTELHLHVVAGQCPIRARMLEQKLERPPFEHRAATATGKLVGLFQHGGTGDMTHMGSDTHLHALLEVAGQQLTGHVEVVGLAKGAVVRLPAE